MTKPTDEERREVAERLRVLASHREVDKEMFHDAIGVWPGGCIDGYDPVGVMELADLIEPPFLPCEETEEWLDSIKHEGQPKTVHEVIEDIIWTCSNVDIGPNGNVSSGVDEGIVSTDALISTWETQLADLIEPEPERTCRMEYDPVHCDYVCTACGEWHSTGMYDACDADDMVLLMSYRYCPKCGAKVEVDE